MGPLSRWAVRRPLIAIASWFLLLVLIGTVSLRFGGDLNDSFELPDTESTTAQQLLADVRGAEAAAGLSGRIVWKSAAGVTDPSVAEPMSALLSEISQVPSVACVTTPYAPEPLGRACPDQGPAPDPAALPDEQRAALAAALESAAKVTAPISPNGTVAYATVTFEGSELSMTDSERILELVGEAQTDVLEVGVSGIQTFGEPPSSEAIGIAVAIVVLLLAFGSVVAAGLPIITALIALGGGLGLVTVAANFLDVATFAPTLGAMIGLGVGIDYALFVLNRYRQAIHAGHEPKAAVLEAVNTAGRSVLFAGVTVIIAVSGLYVMGINFFNGLAVAATVTVLMVMLSALWLLPAVLSLLGHRALAWKVPGLQRRIGREGARFAHYGLLLQKRPILPMIATLIIVLTIAAPTLSLRLGFADDGGQKAGTPSRVAYDLLAEGFGPGSNGPFFIAVQLDTPGDVSAMATAIESISATPGVAAVIPTVEMLPLVVTPETVVTAIQVIPDSKPQDEATSELLERLRGSVLPQVEATAGLVAYVGGFQAVVADFTTVLSDALPLFLFVVVGLGFLALMVLFRSILVPLTAALTSLLSLGAALGITVAVFQWGWLAEFFGVTATGPIFPFLPIMVFAILFGLAMDYHVFLASRMQEEWLLTGDNASAVRRGLAGSGRVVMIAATIMTSVFLAFVPSDQSIIKLFGLALGSAILIDAFLIRLVLVPSLMSLLGQANWWLPAWMDRLLPTVRIEHGEDEIADDPEIEALAAQGAHPDAGDASKATEVPVQP
jgi:putative drug exporter of the RND superfamily